MTSTADLAAQLDTAFGLAGMEHAADRTHVENLLGRLDHGIF